MDKTQVMKKKVIVGLSGGVDSSVAACILLRQGYEVIGTTIKTFYGPEKEGMISDAERVADILGIPYYVVDFADIFKRYVIDNFISEYVNGSTPNPCVRCNRYVKWEALLNMAEKQGADYIATGHYAAIRRLDNGRYAVCRALSDKKDQAYALYNLTQEQLSHTLMPVGEYSKDDIRRIAKDIGLDVADKPDSQDICFIPDNDYGSFLAENADVPHPGNFVDMAGNILGAHEGIHRYTIGQRKGLNIAFGKPMYVCEIRPDTDEVVLGNNEDTFTEYVICNEINHMATDNLAECDNITAKVRYAGRAIPCNVEYINENTVKCKFNIPARAATPGQSIVFYREDVVLGGGIIRRLSDV